MNLALPALLIFAIILPGFIARTQIKKAERSTLDYSPFGVAVSEAIIWAFVLHTLWILLSENLIGNNISWDVLFGLFTSNQELQAKSILKAAQDHNRIWFYFFSLYAFSLLAPKLIRALVIRYRLDRYGCWSAFLFRFSYAPWYYILSGADFKKNETPDFIRISAISDVSGTPYIFEGVLDDYFFDENGSLDRLIITTAQRRPLSHDKNEKGDNKSRFYPIDGDYFVLKYSDIINLNVQYMKLESINTLPPIAK